MLSTGIETQSLGNIGKLHAGGDVELAVDAVKVELDRAGSDSKPCGYFPAAQTCGGQAGYLELAGRQLLHDRAALGVALTDPIDSGI